VKGLLQYFMNYGLIAAVLVWAAVVGLMAYHLEDSPWRWAFVALAAGGIATVGGIIKIRKYIDGLNKSPQQEHHS
jgi:MFS family permease